ncbi:transcriptional regulator, LuxR family [Salipiger mucosus DSM 16094]|uniref:Transcriptional regulator, LuxR family n=2 Tax=Salipiger mucosus TaxID=263378 RepID=S9RS42_9RHOB|nr:transcriptional regulator, LuxR family [Salipiger mucosus DSM 16094]
MVDSDPRVTAMQAAPHKAMHCRQIISDETLHRSRLYREILEPIGIEHSLFANISDDQKVIQCLVFYRGAKQDPFTDRDVRFLQLLEPHISQAAAIREQLRQTEEIQHSAFSALESTGVGWALIDADRRIISGNNVARDLTRHETGDGTETLVIGTQGMIDLSGQIRLLRASPDQNIALLHGVFPSGRVLPVIIVRNDMERFASTIGSPPVETFTVLIATQVSADDWPRMEVLRELYGATRRQAQIAVLVSAGHSTEDAAEEMGLTVGSARQYLKQVMAVLGVGTRGQLSSKVARLLVAS